METIYIYYRNLIMETIYILWRPNICRDPILSIYEYIRTYCNIVINMTFLHKSI